MKAAFILIKESRLQTVPFPQIQRQFPLSFEFNEYYLRFLAYHYVSARFRTFLSDSELERAELGIMTEEDKRGSLSRHHKGLESSQDDDIYPGGTHCNAFIYSWK